jgi:hypothetical protein
MKRSGTLAVGLVMLALTAGCARPGTRPPASTAAASAYPPRTDGPGDQPPNAADNNAWKQRHQLSEAELGTGEAIAARIRPALEALRAGGNFAPDATRQALLDLGYRGEDIMVTTMRLSALSTATTPPPGAVYAVRFAEVGCVIGDVRPERVLVEVTGSAAEFGCLEPYTH